MRTFPVQGTTENLIERLAGYIEPIDQGWLQKIRPATAEQIERLRVIAGLKDLGLDFPPAYHTFLAHMGENDGGLLETQWDGFSEVSIDLILAYYQDATDQCQEMNLPPIDPYHLVFSDHWTEAILYFDLKQGANPPIYSASEIQALNFENYLFQKAFALMEPKYYPFGAGPSTSARQMEILLRHNPKDTSNVFLEKPWMTDTPGNSMLFIESLFEKLGFQKLWFSDLVNYCGILDDTSVMAHGADGFWVNLRGRNQKRVAQLNKHIENYLHSEKY